MDANVHKIKAILFRFVVAAREPEIVYLDRCLHRMRRQTKYPIAYGLTGLNYRNAMASTMNRSNYLTLRILQSVDEPVVDCIRIHVVSAEAILSLCSSGKHSSTQPSSRHSHTHNSQHRHNLSRSSAFDLASIDPSDFIEFRSYTTDCFRAPPLNSKSLPAPFT